MRRRKYDTSRQNTLKVRKLLIAFIVSRMQNSRLTSIEVHFGIIICNLYHFESYSKEDLIKIFWIREPSVVRG